MPLETAPLEFPENFVNRLVIAALVIDRRFFHLFGINPEIAQP